MIFLRRLIAIVPNIGYNIRDLFLLSFRHNYKLKKTFRSVLFWILILYTILGVLIYVSKKYRIEQFFRYCEYTIIKTSLDQRIQLVSTFLNQVKSINDPILKDIVNISNNSNTSFVSVFFDKNSKKIISPIPLDANHFDLNKVDFIDSKITNYKKQPFQTSAELGLEEFFPNSYFISETLSFPNENIGVMVGTKSNKFVFLTKELSKAKLYLDIIAIVVFFFLNVFITFFAIYSIFSFIKKINVSKLKSEMFKKNNEFEFNHIRDLRLSFYRALRKIEASEVERTQMINTMVKHQREIRIGKTVAQIVHDIKSSLFVFEELLHSKNFESSSAAIKPRANAALTKIYSLIEGLRDPEGEKISNKCRAEFKFSEIMSGISWYAKRKNVKINIFPDCDTPEIYCDHNKLERCLQNLIKNAVDYCESYCFVEWKLTKNNDLVVDIIDDGKGVPEDFIDKMFGWRSSNNNVDGTGLGLTYARFVAELAGGSLEYSRKCNLTYFTLVIPGVVFKSSHYPLFSENKVLKRDAVIEDNFSTKNVVIFLFENPLLLSDLKLIEWPKDIKCIYSSDPKEVFDLNQCICLYTDSCSDLIENALSFGISVILHNYNYNEKIILRKILQLRKN